MIVRFKLVDGGKINLVASNVVSFTENDNGTSSLTTTVGTEYEIAESAQAIRGAFRRLNKNEGDTAE